MPGGVRMHMNKQLATQINNDPFTSRDGTTYVIHEVGGYEVHPVDRRIIGYADNLVNLVLLGVESDCREVMDYWQYLQKLGVPLNEAVEQLLLYQAEIQANTYVIPVFPPYSAYVELAGLMCDIDRIYNVNGYDEKLAEIRGQVKGKVESDLVYPDDSSHHQYQKRLTEGLPKIEKIASNFASEIRVDRELCRMGLDVELRTSGGFDTIVESRHCVELTRRSPYIPIRWTEENEKRFLEMDIEQRRTTIQSARSNALELAKPNIERKLEDDQPDIVAVDVTNRMPGFELAAHRCFNDSLFFDFERNFEKAMEIDRDGPVGFLYFYFRSIDPVMGAIPPIAWPA